MLDRCIRVFVCLVSFYSSLKSCLSASVLSRRAVFAALHSECCVRQCSVYRRRCRPTHSKVMCVACRLMAHHRGPVDHTQPSATATHGHGVIRCGEAAAGGGCWWWSVCPRRRCVVLSPLRRCSEHGECVASREALLAFVKMVPVLKLETTKRTVVINLGKINVTSTNICL